MKENIKKEDLKEIIVDLINDEYIHKSEICKLIQQTEWSTEKDYRLRYLDFYNKVLDLIGKEYYKRYDIFSHLGNNLEDK